MPFPLLAVSLSLLLPSAFAADVICENLPKNQCAFAVSSSSKRCILESYQGVGAQTEYKCRTSDIGVARISAHIETDECIENCGVGRNSVGISSDLLMELRFLDKLCSPECFQRCANIIDLYYNLAAAEGTHLPDLCQAHLSGAASRPANDPAYSPIGSPNASPKYSLMGSPKASPIGSPLGSPKASSIDRPLGPIKASPKASPLASPKANPTDGPLDTPTNNPLSSPLDSAEDDSAFEAPAIDGEDGADPEQDDNEVVA